LSSRELREIKRILRRIQEEQVLSSFDTVLLLLLPLTTFLVEAASILRTQSPIMSQISQAFAITFTCVLVYLIYGILRGSDSIRVSAWFYFFLLSIEVVVLYSYTGIISLFVGKQVTFPFSIPFVGGSLCTTVGISLRLIRWIKRTMQRRLPLRAAKIERIFRKFWKKSRTSYPDMVFVLVGLGALLLSARDTADLPSYLFEPLEILMSICVVLSIMGLVGGWVTKKIVLAGEWIAKKVGGGGPPRQ